MTPLVSGLASVASFLFNAASSRAPAASASASSSTSTDAGPSTVLKLSAEAQPLAGAAGKAVHKAAATQTPVSAATGGSGKVVSKEDFQALLTQFGASEAQKEQITAGLDTNKDGAISQDEFLKGLAKTKGDQAGTALSQSLMQVMDQAGNRDGTVGRKEFLTLTTAFAATAQGSKKV